MNKYFSTLWLAIAVLLCTSLTHAQFNAGIYSLTPLYDDRCNDGGTPLGPECNGVIYWDQNNNGPDPSDSPPIVGNGFAECNFNTFPLNGAEMLGIPGAFFLETLFTISTTTPQPSRYYIVVECRGPRWTSAVFTIHNGVNDYDISQGWICEYIHHLPCDEPTYLLYEPQHNGEPISDCVSLCAGVPVQICYGPLSPNSRPHFHFTAGCTIPDHCDLECTPAHFFYDDAGWVYNQVDRTWCTWIVASNEGCVCLGEDFLPIEFASFEAQPRDGENVVVWSTTSEQDIDYFRLNRDGQIAYTVAGSNTSTGSTYSFLDENLVNGRTYTYDLEVVNLDGTIDVWPSVATATPSIDNAIITEYALHQNYPNPFNPNTSIVFDVLEENNVNLRVFNSMGQEVATLVEGSMSSGRHTVDFDAHNLTSGLYFYTVKIGTDFTATKKMLLIK